MVSLINKVAIITGASRSIGKAIAIRLAENGAIVVVNYNSGADEAQAVVDEITSKGGQAIAMQADIGKIADIRRLFQSVIDLFGKLDILVNNAGIARGGLVADVSEEDYNAVFDLNVKGVLFCLQEAALRMQDNGRIVNVSSSTTLFPSPGLAIYAASKAAEKLFTEVLAKELGGKGITVNSVVPGPTSPGMFDNAPPEQQKMAIASSPFNRLGQPEDIADVVSFLVSEESRWITGQHILANGGATI